MPRFCTNCGSQVEPGASSCGSCGAPTSEQPNTAISRPSHTRPDPPLSTSFEDGRYQVKSLLGEGGMKRVYLVNDTLLDREVASALIKSEGLDEADHKRILQDSADHGAAGRPSEHHADI